MAEGESDSDGANAASSGGVRDAIVEQRGRLSLVWVIPIVAALVGAWLTYHTFSQRGPAVTITFDSAEGLEAGKTTVKYKDVSTKMFLKAATAQGVSPFEIASIRFYAEDHRKGAFSVGAPTSHVEEITGRPAESFETIARRYITNPDLIAPGLRAGTRLGALGFAIKMLLTPAPDLDRWERERGHPMIKNPVVAPDSPEWRRAAGRQELLLQGAPPTAKDSVAAMSA